MLKPDFDRTVTGYMWLDLILDPILCRYFEWSGRRTRHKLFLRLGDGDAEVGRAIFHQAVRESVEGSSSR